MSIIKGKVRATSSSLEGISKIIKEDLFWSKVEFIPCEGGWSLANLKGIVKAYKVHEKRNRFQLIEVAAK